MQRRHLAVWIVASVGAHVAVVAGLAGPGTSPAPRAATSSPLIVELTRSRLPGLSLPATVARIAPGPAAPSDTTVSARSSTHAIASPPRPAQHEPSEGAVALPRAALHANAATTPAIAGAAAPPLPSPDMANDARAADVPSPAHLQGGPPTLAAGIEDRPAEPVDPAAPPHPGLPPPADMPLSDPPPAVALASEAPPPAVALASDAPPPSPPLPSARLRADGGDVAAGVALAAMALPAGPGRFGAAPQDGGAIEAARVTEEMARRGAAFEQQQRMRMERIASLETAIVAASTDWLPPPREFEGECESIPARNNVPTLRCSEAVAVDPAVLERSPIAAALAQLSGLIGRHAGVRLAFARNRFDLSLQYGDNPLQHGR